MSGFFEQMCKILAEEEEKSPGFISQNSDLEQFFAPVQKKTASPAVAVDTSAKATPATPVTPAAPAAVPSGSDLPGDLASLARIVAGCRNCPLAASRSNVVFGEGNPDARLMFIGEGPGFDEDRLGRPFVGKAGQLLDKMISAMQFTREEVYIANIVKCRPPDNRVPTPEEAACCIGYLHRQIELIRPEVIVLLGATAVKFLLNTTSGISKMRGRWLSYENIPVMPTFHPAFLLRQESAKREAWQDLQQVMARFGKYHKR